MSRSPTALVRCLLTLLALFVLHGLAPAQELATGPVPKLDWQSLVDRPDLWPRDGLLAENTTIDGEMVLEGAKLTIYRLDRDLVSVTLPGVPEVSGFHDLNPDQTDALEVANRYYAGLSPAQRELDFPTLAQRPELWPERVKLGLPIQVVGPSISEGYPLGSEFAFGCVIGLEARLFFSEVDFAPAVQAYATDLIEHARAVLAGEREPTEEGRVCRDLKGKLVDLGRHGRRAKLSTSRPPKYLLLYYSAGWCGPCHKFTAKLIEFYREHKQAGKLFEVVFVSRDHSEDGWKDYTKQSKFPWLALRFDKLDEVPITQAYAAAGIPQLMVLDRAGRVLIDSFEGERNLGPDSALTRFTELLEKDEKEEPAERRRSRS